MAILNLFFNISTPLIIYGVLCMLMDCFSLKSIFSKVVYLAIMTYMCGFYIIVNFMTGYTDITGEYLFMGML